MPVSKTPTATQPKTLVVRNFSAQPQKTAATPPAVKVTETPPALPAAAPVPQDAARPALRLPLPAACFVARQSSLKEAEARLKMYAIISMARQVAALRGNELSGIRLQAAQIAELAEEAMVELGELAHPLFCDDGAEEVTYALE